MKLFAKISAFCLAVLVVASVMSSCKKEYTTIKGDPTNTRIYTLDNGLTVYLTPIKKEPRIQTYIAVRVGSKNDPSETTGLSHYLEHIMFKGTTNYGTTNYEAEKPLLDQITEEFEKYRTLTDPEERKAQYAKIDSISYAASEYFIGNEYDKIMAQMGAQGSNAFTSFDMTVYTEDIPSNQVEAWAKVQSDRFKNMVIRGFHTELEAVYEECNLGLSSDGGNAVDTLLFAMFDKHPYGEQTTIGTQEHLKNPSIVNIQKHFDNFYVPNNVAICMAGDFDPDKVIATIKQYFGDWKKNDNLKLLEFEDEEPINAHIEKTVYGLESPFVQMGWRFPSAYKAGREGLNYTEDTLYMLTNVLTNRGGAGLIDQNVNRPQKTLGAAAYSYTLSDYIVFFLECEPREGQSLEEAKAIVMEELEKVKRGDFDSTVLTSIVNNFRRQQMQAQDSYRALASWQYNAFINHLPWDYVIGEGDRIAKITKEDVVAFANRHFGDNYVQVNKVQGPQVGVKKLEKPAITAIRTNRDTSSQFLRDMETLANSAAPIQPVFVDFDKDMSVGKLSNGLDFYYKHNDDNELFNLAYYFTNGSNDIDILPYAISYVQALGTDSLTADQISSKFYNLACSFYANPGANDVTVALSGLGSSMEEAVALLENFLANVKADENLLEMMKQNWILEKMNAKTSKKANESAVQMYAIYGPENPMTMDLKPAQIAALTSDQLIAAVKDVLAHKHAVIYYGPESKENMLQKLPQMHKVAENLPEFGPSKLFKAWSTQTPCVYLAPYKANQINMYKVISYDDVEYNPANDAIVNLYDIYFGSGMSSIVFQDIREAKGLAYHASARTSLPGRKGEVPFYLARVYTQNDKMLDAMSAMDEILTDMPANQKSFDVAKANAVQNLATRRYNGANVIWHYISLQEKGVGADYDKQVYDKISGLNLEDIVSYQQANVKNRSYVTGILGNPAELNLTGIAPSYGKVVILRTEDIFGY
ncbi:MAG: insulinase family protein [Bacteroidales bacterium]|nr:insulinase family protein [Bacteroidales bacterium]